jgi:hypothetical protein
MSIRIGAKVRVVQGALAGRTGQVTATDHLSSGVIALVVFRKKFKYGDGIHVVFLDDLVEKDHRGAWGVNAKTNMEIMLKGLSGPVVLLADKNESSGKSAILPDRYLVEIGSTAWTEDRI